MANVMGVGIIGNGLKRIKIETSEEISKRENLNETIAIFVSKQLRGDEKSEKNFDRLNTVAGLLKGGLLKQELNHTSIGTVEYYKIGIFLPFLDRLTWTAKPK